MSSNRKFSRNWRKVAKTKTESSLHFKYFSKSSSWWKRKKLLEFLVLDGIEAGPCHEAAFKGDPPLKTRIQLRLRPPHLTQTELATQWTKESTYWWEIFFFVIFQDGNDWKFSEIGLVVVVNSSLTTLLKKANSYL